MKSDKMIIDEYVPLSIQEIGERFGVTSKELISFGDDKAKIKCEAIQRGRKLKKKGKLVLVTAITPTKAGIGKTTTTIGLGDALSSLGEKTSITLREPSLGPFLGVKGGATGGGYSQVYPSEDINLFFTGDFPAITSANNYISAVIDNHFHFNPTLGLDPRRVTVKRVIDLNDRSLRNVVIGLGGRTNGTPRETGFDITPASEVMAVLCLSKTYEELEKNLNNITVGLTFDRTPVKVEEFGIGPTLMKLLKKAFLPNLVQTLSGTPALIHGGPFANIAHGCNSLIATETALTFSDWVITEAGFGSDLGAEKFFDIKCQYGGLEPSCAVLVVTLPALRLHGGQNSKEIYEANMEALEKGLCNMDKHIENIRKFGIEPVVCLNRFKDDTDEEILFLRNYIEKTHKCPFAVNEAYFKGAAGAVELASQVIKVVENSENKFKPLYSFEDSMKSKIKKVATEIYGAKDVIYSKEAKRSLRLIKKLNLENLPVCIAKTPMSLSEDPSAIGRPEDFEINVSSIVINSGAGFVVPITGKIIRMPGLPKKIILDR